MIKRYNLYSLMACEPIIDENEKGEWVQYEDIKHLIEKPADLPGASNGYALLDDVALKKINYFVYKYSTSGKFDCPICGAIDECEKWCIMPELIEIAEKTKEISSNM